MFIRKQPNAYVGCSTLELDLSERDIQTDTVVPIPTDPYWYSRTEYLIASYDSFIIS